MLNLPLVSLTFLDFPYLLCFEISKSIIPEKIQLYIVLKHTISLHTVFAICSGDHFLWSFSDMHLVILLSTFGFLPLDDHFSILSFSAQIASYSLSHLFNSLDIVE